MGAAAADSPSLNTQEFLRKRSRVCHDAQMESDRGVQQVVDSAVLAAMAHPARRRLMDVLKVHGPATASRLAERTQQAAANVSHHIRVLAEAGLVEVAPELARDRRERWWRLVTPGLRWSTQDFDDDPAGAAIAEAALSLNLEHHVSLVRAWYAAEGANRNHWQDAAFSTDKWLHLTPDELVKLSREVIALLDGWAARAVPEDGQQRDPVFVFTFGVPAQP